MWGSHSADSGKLQILTRTNFNLGIKNVFVHGFNLVSVIDVINHNINRTTPFTGEIIYIDIVIASIRVAVLSSHIQNSSFAFSKRAKVSKHNKGMYNEESMQKT